VAQVFAAYFSQRRAGGSAQLASGGRTPADAVLALLCVLFIASACALGSFIVNSLLRSLFRCSSACTNGGIRLKPHRRDGVAARRAAFVKGLLRGQRRASLQMK